MRPRHALYRLARIAAWTIGSRASSHARFGKARRLAQVVPPRERDAGDVEQQEDFKRVIGATGCGNGGAEPARDKIAAASTDCADEAERSRGFEPRCFERERAASLTPALG